MTSKDTTTIGIIGGGNSAHILCNILSRAQFKIILITRRPNEWNSDGITMRYGTDSNPNPTIYKGNTFIVSNNYSQISEADILFLCCPVSAEIELLSKVKPFIKDTALIGTVFGQARFDKMVRYIFGDEQPCFAFIQIPWICRATKYGQTVSNLGDQDVDLAFRKKDRLLLSKLNMNWLKYIHTDKSKHIRKDSFFREWFFPSNIIIHPGICYGRYLTNSSESYFYRNISPMSGACIDQLDIERVKIINTLNKRYNLNINNISIVTAWNTMWNMQGANMVECINHDPSLENIKAGKNIQNNAKHRFFQDDIPYGLCYIKHVAEYLNIDTPFIDRVIRWAQDVMETEYLDKNGKLIRKHLPGYYANYEYRSSFNLQKYSTSKCLELIDGVLNELSTSER